MLPAFDGAFDELGLLKNLEVLRDCAWCHVVVVAQLFHGLAAVEQVIQHLSANRIGEGGECGVQVDHGLADSILFRYF